VERSYFLANSIHKHLPDWVLAASATCDLIDMISSIMDESRFCIKRQALDIAFMYKKYNSLDKNHRSVCSKYVVAEGIIGIHANI
jgi:hypothetical protein